MQPKPTTVDQLIAALAGKAHGIVTRIELLAAGVTEREIKQRLKRGSLLPVFRAVYRVGHAAPSAEADYMAAVKAIHRLPLAGVQADARARQLPVPRNALCLGAGPQTRARSVRARRRVPVSQCFSMPTS
jgi:hypothetical protein